MSDCAFVLGSSCGTLDEYLCCEMMAEMGLITLTFGRTTLAPILSC